MSQCVVESGSSLAIARNLVHWHASFCADTSCNVTSMLCISYLINIIGSVIERVSVYWHKFSFNSGSYSFLDASLFNIAAS